MRTSPSTAGAARIIRTCCASRRITPNRRKILLEQNYRSTRTVVETARAVIDRNTARTHKNLFSERPEGLKITLYEAIDDHAEAAYVVDTIAAAHFLQTGERGRPGGDVPHQRAIPPAGGSLHPLRDALPPGGGAAVLWKTRDQGRDLLPAPGFQPGR